MEIPGRQALEDAYIRRMSKLRIRHRKELRAYLDAGEPVPDEFWQRVERETREEELTVLLLLFMLSANYHAGGDAEGRGIVSEMTRTTLQQSGQVYAQRRAEELASRTVARAREAVRGAGPDSLIGGTGITRLVTGDESTSNSTSATKNNAPVISEVTIIVDRAFSPSDVIRDAVTETTAAQSIGAETAMKLDPFGLSNDDIWITEYDAKVCPICRPLHERKREVWEAQFPDGPPAHPNCRCTIQYANRALARFSG